MVAEFRDPIYPGLVSTGKVERGGDKPFHAVINAENFTRSRRCCSPIAARSTRSTSTRRTTLDAKDWKYNNDYVESDDSTATRSGSPLWSGASYWRRSC